MSYNNIILGVDVTETPVITAIVVADVLGVLHNHPEAEGGYEGARGLCVGALCHSLAVDTLALLPQR